MTNSVLILGGGMGGLAAARRLRRLLPARIGITLVDRVPLYTLAASYLWIMTGRRRAEDIGVRLDALTGRFDGRGACFVEVGGGRAALGAGRFYAEPVPQVRPRGPGRALHLAKVVAERRWLRSMG